jgi:hypothetical protein
VVEVVMRYKDSREKLIRRAVIALLPCLAAFAPERFAQVRGLGRVNVAKGTTMGSAGREVPPGWVWVYILGTRVQARQPPFFQSGLRAER